MSSNTSLEKLQAELVEAEKLVAEIQYQLGPRRKYATLEKKQKKNAEMRRHRRADKDRENELRYRKANREKINEYHRQRYAANPKLYRQDPEKARETKHRYYVTNRERIWYAPEAIEKRRQYYEANPEKSISWERRRKAQFRKRWAAEVEGAAMSNGRP